MTEPKTSLGKNSSSLTEARQYQEQYLASLLGSGESSDQDPQPAPVWPVPQTVPQGEAASYWQPQQSSVIGRVAEVPAPQFPRKVNPVYQESQVPEPGFCGDSNHPRDVGVVTGGQRIVNNVLPEPRISASELQTDNSYAGGGQKITVAEAKNLLVERVVRNHLNPDSPTPHPPARLKAEKKVRDHLTSMLEQSAEVELNNRAPLPPPKDRPRGISMSPEPPRPDTSASRRPAEAYPDPTPLLNSLRPQPRAPSVVIEGYEQPARVAASRESNRRHSTAATEGLECSQRPVSRAATGTSKHHRSATVPALAVSHSSMDAGDRYPAFNHSQASQRYHAVSVEDAADDSVSEASYEAPPRPM